MRAIKKGQEPQELREYRCQPGAVYDGPLFTAVKDAIREQLLREQGYLCAYCMARIDGKQQKIKVEHWRCQDNHADEQLDYKNLLAVCDGNEGEPFAMQTCDTRKGNQDLKYNPAALSHRIESQIRFIGDGRIEADDEEFDAQLNKVLNLNEDRLKKNRLRVLKAVKTILSQLPGSRTSAELQRLINKWSTPDQDGYLREYCAVAIYYLRKRQKI